MIEGNRFKMILSRLILVVGLSICILLLPMLLTMARYRNVEKMKDKLSSVKGLTLVCEWRHEDMTIEDFGFTFKTSLGEAVRVDFYEGLEWHGLFDDYDGVVVSKPYNPDTNSYSRVYIEKSELIAKGISGGAAENVFENIDQVLKIAKWKGFREIHPPISDRWIIIYCDLDEKSYFGHSLISTHYKKLN